MISCVDNNQVETTDGYYSILHAGYVQITVASDVDHDEFWKDYSGGQ